ncbi:470_t:CDS:2, partial [Scutellospora calospora]
MSATSLQPQQTQQTQQRPGFRKIMTWSSRRSNNKKHPHLFYDSAPEGGEDQQNIPAPASPTPSVKSLKSGRPSLFATFARRNSTKSEHSSRSRSPNSRSPTSPRPSNDSCNLTENLMEDFRTPSPTPSRNSMIFERDIENHDRLSVHEAIDLAIPPALNNVAEAFVNEEIPIITEEGTESIIKNKNESDSLWINTMGEVEGRKRLSLINYADIANRSPSPGPFDQKNTIAETLRVTTPREMNGLT